MNTIKKVIVVSKTHLDLGFTDYAESIKKKYIEEFIPGAIDLAERVNENGSKNFIWTTGSWILKEALEKSDSNNRERLEKAIKSGDIVAHALPFTTHTELLDEDTLDYGLSIVESLDKIRGRKTVAAKMTDVPGHTRGLVKILHKHGIKLLHIGVNGASAVPEVPECFLWKNGEAEVIVIYSGAYGGAFKSDFAEEILYFDHTVDNRGAPSPEKVLAKLNAIREEYPDYEVTAGTLDDFADVIWEQRKKLPVLECEIGDTWIHGSAADPYKSAALRTLIRLKNAWLKDGSLYKEGKEYTALADTILLLAEHTCGMDNKTYFADYENYLKKDFQAARKRDKVVINYPDRDYPQNRLTLKGIEEGYYKQGSYSVIEKSWAEQRKFISDVLKDLSPEHFEQAISALHSLKPEKMQKINTEYQLPCTVKKGKWELKINEHGGIGRLTFDGNEVIKNNNKPIIEYHSYCKADYDFWLTHYSRDLEETAEWVMGDFSRPLLKYVEGKYPTGRFSYTAERAELIESKSDLKITVNLKCDDRLCEELGAPGLIQITYLLGISGLNFSVDWLGKDASRLTEAIFLRLFPADCDFKMLKINDWVKPEDVISMGGRNLHAVNKCRLDFGKNAFDIINLHSPLLSVGKGKILEYDNKIEDFKKDGISYCLYNNVWGTNFPLWYEDNARFIYKIERI